MSIYVGINDLAWRPCFCSVWLLSWCQSQICIEKELPMIYFFLPSFHAMVLQCLTSILQFTDSWPQFPPDHHNYLEKMLNKVCFFFLNGMEKILYFSEGNQRKYHRDICILFINSTEKNPMNWWRLHCCLKELAPWEFHCCVYLITTVIALFIHILECPKVSEVVIINASLSSKTDPHFFASNGQEEAPFSSGRKESQCYCRYVAYALITTCKVISFLSISLLVTMTIFLPAGMN